MDKKESIFQDFIPQLKQFVQSEMVFGKPYEIGDVTIIPVNSVRIGFAFGEGNGTKENIKSDISAKGGGGGGVMVNPIAFIIIKDGTVSLHTISSGGIENIMEKIPDFLEKIINLSSKIKKDSKE